MSADGAKSKTGFGLDILRKIMSKKFDCIGVTYHFAGKLAGALWHSQYPCAAVIADNSWPPTENRNPPPAP
jgi:hypothetical protein